MPQRSTLESPVAPRQAPLRPSARLAWLIAALAMLAVVLGCPRAALAQAFPSKPVTLVVPYAPGGGTDIVARTLAQALASHWGQRVVVENHAGADGLIGTQRVLNATPDGHTLLVQLNQILLWKWTLPAAKIDPLNDFRLISKIQVSPIAIAVAARHPATTLKEYLADCRGAGKACSFGTATASAMLVGRQLMEMGGVTTAVQVPYKGTAPMLTDLLGGHLSMGMPSASSGMAQAKSGAIRILAIGGSRRFPLLPAVPTFEESGYPIPGETWYGLMVARATPPEVADALAAAVQAVAKKPELIAIIEANGGVPVFGTPAEFQQDMRREIDFLAPVGARFLKPAAP